MSDGMSEKEIHAVLDKYIEVLKKMDSEKNYTVKLSVKNHTYVCKSISTIEDDDE